MATRQEDSASTFEAFEEVSRFNEYDPIRRLVLYRVSDAYRDQAFLDTVWETQEFTAAPNFDEAVDEYDHFVDVFRKQGIQIDIMRSEEELGLAAIYVRDSVIMAPRGAILCNMKNTYRDSEPAAAGDFLKRLDVPIVGAISGKGTLEGGDFVWFDEVTCAVAQGYRTNADGISQLKHHLGPRVHVEVVPLPHHRGPAECLHLMSIISPLDADLALAYSPLMSVAFRDWLIDRDIELVGVPDEEFETTMGCNVLALAPRKCLVMEGNSVTRSRLEGAGCEVISYKGEEISIKGAGGPTCLTRPLLRHASCRSSA